MIDFDATTNHYDDGEDNAAVRKITARTMTDRTTKETSFHCRVNNNVTIGFALAIAATVATLPSLPWGDGHR